MSYIKNYFHDEITERQSHTGYYCDDYESNEAKKREDEYQEERGIEAWKESREIPF